MARTSRKDLTSQIAATAANDQVIVSITGPKGKLLLPVTGKLNIKGEFAYVSLPSVEGLFKADDKGNLTKTSVDTDAESLFFPERAEELKKNQEEIALLKELAKKHSFGLIQAEGTTVKRTRAPKGTRVVAPKKPMPKKGDKFVSTQNGIGYTVESVDGKQIKMKGDDGTTKDVTYSGIFWRWHNPA